MMALSGKYSTRLTKSSRPLTSAWRSCTVTDVKFLHGCHTYHLLCLPLAGGRGRQCGLAQWQVHFCSSECLDFMVEWAEVFNVFAELKCALNDAISMC